MVDKMIKYTKIEIAIVIIFVILSIPLWNFLNKKLTSNLTMALEQETRLELIQNNVDGYDNLIVNNGYTEEKIYQLLLVTESNNDYTSIMINGKTYQLKDFTKKQKDNLYAYILITDTIKQTRKGYKIDLNFDNNEIIYYYELKEF